MLGAAYGHGMAFGRFLAGLSGPLVRLVFRPDVSGREHIPAGGCVISANHLSGFDAWALSYTFRGRFVRYMGKNDLFRRPLLGPVVRSLGVFPARAEGSLAGGVTRAAELVAVGETVAIFPEGARRRGMTRRPRRGAARTALLAGVPLVPVAICGTDGWRDQARWSIAVGAPVRLDDLSDIDLETATGEATRRLWDAITTLEDGLTGAGVR
jgi:1-acyl-sn-glycerol-3-phosphate acyltransferase